MLEMLLSKVNRYGGLKPKDFCEYFKNNVNLCLRTEKWAYSKRISILSLNTLFWHQRLILKKRELPSKLIKKLIKIYLFQNYVWKAQHKLIRQSFQSHIRM